MDDSPALMIMLMTIPAILTTGVAALNARKLNAQWRARRDARAHAKAPAAH